MNRWRPFSSATLIWRVIGKCNSWTLDLSQMKKIPLYEGARRLYVAIQVYESLDDAEEVADCRFTPLMTPRIRNLDVHAKRQVNLLAGYLSAVQAASPPPHAATGETSETLEPFVATP